ncbi:sodium:calcium antiporter [Roseovarius rhodophyticola]|uniref:Sodium/calcium exchanger membrane region domain-containing protein n=1 Tax=Roseovarius rhodophyticola TaxID=3080827 RepID=A0ABZ2TED8_9RHOB
MEATLLVLMLGLTLVITTLNEPFAIWGIGLGSCVIALFYCGAIWLLRRYDDASDWVPVDLPEQKLSGFTDPSGLAGTRSSALLLQTALACIAILVFGLLLVLFAERLAVQSGLGASFIGVTLLAGATSLPELTTSIAAVRLGAYTMAISNIFGSNLIMLVLVFPADLLFRSGPIMRQASDTVSLALGFGIIVTSLYLSGLIVRRKPKIGKVGVDSVLVLLVFAFSLLAYYVAR